MSSRKFPITVKHLPKSPPYVAPTPVPLKGTFAGLSPQRERVRHVTHGTHALNELADAWEAEADMLDEAEPERSVAEQLGECLLNTDIGALVTQWDPTRSGQCMKLEFRLRLKSVLTTGGYTDPGPRALDVIFDKFDADKSGAIDVLEQKKLLQMLKSDGHKFRNTKGVRFFEGLERATELRRRAQLARDAAATVVKADQKEAELHDFKAALSQDLEVQLGLTLARRRIKVGDMVGGYAKDIKGLNPDDFLSMVTAVGVHAPAQEVLGLFGRIDDDGSGHIDANEAGVFLRELQKRGVDAMAERDKKTRITSGLRRRAEALSKAVMSLPPLIKGSLDVIDEGGELAESPPQEVPKKASRGKGMSLALDKAKELGNQLGDAMSSWRGGGESARGVQRQRDEKEKEKRVQAIAQDALKKLPQRMLAKGWRSWVESHELRVARMKLLSAAIVHMKHKDLCKGLDKWMEFHGQRVRVLRTLQAALVKFSHQELCRGYAGWISWYGHEMETKRLMSIAAHSAAKLHSPHLLAKFETWRRQCVWLGPRRASSGSFQSAIFECLTACRMQRCICGAQGSKPVRQQVVASPNIVFARLNAWNL